MHLLANSNDSTPFCLTDFFFFSILADVAIVKGFFLYFVFLALRSYLYGTVRSVDLIEVGFLL